MSREDHEIVCPQCGKRGVATFHEDESGNAYWGRGNDRWSVAEDSGFHIRAGESGRCPEAHEHYRLDDDVCCDACKIPVKTGALIVPPKNKG